MSVFQDLGIKNPHTEEVRCHLTVAFQKAAKKYKLDVSDADSFKLANHGAMRMSLERIAKTIEKNGFEIEYTVKLKRKG